MPPDPNNPGPPPEAGDDFQPPVNNTNPIPPERREGVPTTLGETLRSPLTRRVVTHVILALGLVATIVGSSFLFARDAEELGKEWVANLRPGRRSPNDANPLEPRERVLDSMLPLSDTERRRMQFQLDDIRKKAKHHLDVAVFYYSRFYMSIVAFSIAAALAAISLAIISKRGLDKVSEYIVTMFLVMTALALFYQSFPGVFQQKKNVDDNKALYLKYINLEDDVATYNVTGSVTVMNTAAAAAVSPEANSSAKTNSQISNTNASNNAAVVPSSSPVTVVREYSIITLKPSEFIHYIDYQLKKYNDIAIGFDESKAASFANEQFNLQEYDEISFRAGEGCGKRERAGVEACRGTLSKGGSEW